jgi:hypothetical protein
VPLIEELEHKMLVIRNNELAPATLFSPILRMAAHAALTVIEKYYALTDDCEVYRIAISKFLQMRCAAEECGLLD